MSKSIKDYEAVRLSQGVTVTVIEDIAGDLVSITGGVRWDGRNIGFIHLCRKSGVHFDMTSMGLDDGTLIEVLQTVGEIAGLYEETCFINSNTDL